MTVANPLAGLTVSEPQPVKRPADPNIRSNRYGGRCAECQQWVEEETGRIEKSRDGRWLVFHIGECPEHPTAAFDPADVDETLPPRGYYAVNGKRYFVDRGRGKWEGWLFFKTGSDYHDRQRLGSIPPGGAYKGKASEALQAILLSPEERAKEYGQITGSCALCGRKLEDETSRAYGIGPVCREKGIF